MGQLLEYAHYPELAGAPLFVVVGDAPAFPDDRLYLEFLRKRYSLDLYYAQYVWAREVLVGTPEKQFNKLVKQARLGRAKRAATDVRHS